MTELSSGQTSALTASRSRKWRPRFSPNGATIAFTELDTLNVYEMPSAGGKPELICRECGQITGWSLDGTRALVNALDGSIFLLDLKSRRKTRVLNRSGDFLADAFFSPDDRWIAFSDSTPFWRMYIVPFAGEHPIESSAWINIMEGHGGPAWSPDGNLVYDVSDRDGFLCLWSQRLDPQTKRPIGSPFPVFHAHNARISLRAGVEGSLLSAGHDRMFFEMTETNGNIWMQEWTDR